MHPRRLAVVIVLLLAVAIMVVRIVLTYSVFSDVIDEPYHIGAGVGMLESGRHTYGVQHPPLPRLVAAVPLILSGVTDPLSRGRKSIQPDLTAFDIGNRILLESPLPYWKVLTRARAAMLLFPIAAVIYVYLLGRYLGNRLIGCIAAVFFSTDATLLGHASWVTTDVAAAAGYLAATYHGIRCIAHPSPRRSLAAGCALGIALACKFSCAVVVIALTVILITRGRRVLDRLPRQFALGAACIFAAFITLWATYFFDIGRIDDSITLAGTGQLERIPHWLKTTPIPMPSAIIGYLVLAWHNQMGHFTYLNGQVTETGSWIYFPEAIVIKSPSALVIGLGIALCAWLLARRRRPQRAVCLAVPMIVFLCMSMMSNINIGVRHVLPAIPFLYLLVAFCLGRGWKALLMIGLILLAFAETLSVHPDYLPFFNWFVGGPPNGEKYLLDSNLDWSQDQARLHDWLEENARGRLVTLQIFGNPRLRQWPHANFNLAPESAAPSGIFAISKNYGYDLYPSRASNSWVRRRRPTARVGWSIDIYDLTEQKNTNRRE